MGIKKKILIIFFSIIFLFGIIKIFTSIASISKEKIKKQTINQISVSLQNCFDIKNKSKRTYNESIKLIEFCMNKYSNYWEMKKYYYEVCIY